MILPECFVDTTLAETLSFPQTKYGYKHKRSCTKVFVEMNKRTKDVLFGIIDNDKEPPPAFNSFKLLKSHSENLAIYKHNDRQHYIVTIGRKGKAIEDFILKNAEKCGISMLEHNLPDNLSELIKLTKDITTKNNPDLKRLFKAIKQNENSDFHTLSQWIELFKANPYDFHAKI